MNFKNCPDFQCYQCLVQAVNYLSKCGTLCNLHSLEWDFDFTKRKEKKEAEKSIGNIGLKLHIRKMDQKTYNRTLHLTAIYYTIFSNTHGMFPRVHHILGHKINLNKFKIDIISSIFSGQNSSQLEINYTKKTVKFKMIQRLSHILLNNQCIKEEIKEKLKIS